MFCISSSAWWHSVAYPGLNLYLVGFYDFRLLFPYERNMVVLIFHINWKDEQSFKVIKNSFTSWDMGSGFYTYTWIACLMLMVVVYDGRCWGNINIPFQVFVTFYCLVNCLTMESYRDGNGTVISVPAVFFFCYIAFLQ